jgi:uncharacterized protein YegL
VGEGFKEIEHYPQEMKCPVVLCLDTSGSMSGEPISELNRAVEVLKNDLISDPKAKKVVEIAIVTFGGGITVQDFVVPEFMEPPEFEANGDTPMGEALLKALDLIEERKKIYNENGINYYRPWLILITDGYPTDMTRGDPKWNGLKRKLAEWEENRKVIAWAFGTSTADFDALKDLFSKVYKLHDYSSFAPLFRWLSRSMSKVSRSKEGERIFIEKPPGEEIELEV